MELALPVQEGWGTPMERLTTVHLAMSQEATKRATPQGASKAVPMVQSTTPQLIKAVPMVRLDTPQGLEIDAFSNIGAGLGLGDVESASKGLGNVRSAAKSSGSTKAGDTGDGRSLSDVIQGNIDGSLGVNAWVAG
ncbi:unnamed protein product [Ilex paraguariensis]|uniref:Uncharacterized protein n=1 Tax=Ilex paraguariensis TaxID=185542 RepID=A0ABC8TNX1_9AQUA